MGHPVPELVQMSHAQWQIASLGTVPNEKFPEVGSEKGQYWKWVSLLEMGMPFPVLVNCAFGYLHMYGNPRMRTISLCIMGSVAANSNITILSILAAM